MRCHVIEALGMLVAVGLEHMPDIADALSRRHGLVISRADYRALLRDFSDQRWPRHYVLPGQGAGVGGEHGERFTTLGLVTKARGAAAQLIEAVATLEACIKEYQSDEGPTWLADFWANGTEKTVVTQA